jgi:hypothetical protein
MDDIVGPKNDFMTEVDDIFAEADAESKVGSAEVQDGGAEFGADDIESIRHPLKRKAETGGQGSKSGCRNLDQHCHV